MPFIVNKDVKINYEVEGAGFPLVLAHQGTDSIDYWFRNNYVCLLYTSPSPRDS